LLALPGSSAKRQRPDSAELKQLDKRLKALENQLRAQTSVIESSDELQDVEADLAKQQEVLGNLRAETMVDPEMDDDVQVFVGGGSWLGVGVSEVTAEKAHELKLPAERGALLGKIVPDSPAAKGGLKENDVVTEINGQRVEGSDQFRRMIREIPSGRTAELTVWRDGRAQKISVTLGKSEMRHPNVMFKGAPGAFAFRTPELPGVQELPELPNMGDFQNFEFSFHAQPRLGIDAENLEGDFGKYFGAPEGEGVLVREVFPDSAAAKAGLQSGDVITTVNGERIRTISELREKLATEKEAKSAKLGLIRNKSEISVTVEIPALPKKQMRRLSERTKI
jgi:C-terminal processing protease CtpA/Prc